MKSYFVSCQHRWVLGLRADKNVVTSPDSPQKPSGHRACVSVSRAIWGGWSGRVGGARWTMLFWVGWKRREGGAASQLLRVMWGLKEREAGRLTASTTHTHTHTQSLTPTLLTKQTLWRHVECHWQSVLVVWLFGGVLYVYLLSTVELVRQSHWGHFCVIVAPV